MSSARRLLSTLVVAAAWLVTASPAFAGPPVANAGADAAKAVGLVVTLDGTASSDPDGDPLTYAWVIESAPAASLGVLKNPTSTRPKLTLDRPGAYVLRLTVTAGGQTGSDTVTVTTLNGAPIANAGPDQWATVGQTVTLDGSGSADPDDQAITHAWTLTRPSGSTATLSATNVPRPTFVVDKAGKYTAKLTVSDGVLSKTDTAFVSTGNVAPVAGIAPLPEKVALGTTVVLDGSPSNDANGQALTFAWTLTKPAASAAVLSDATALRPSFVADVKGRYTAKLRVSDGALTSTPATSGVGTTAKKLAPVADAGTDQVVASGATVQLDGSGTTDGNGDRVYAGWSFVTRPAGSAAAFSDAAAFAPTFEADVPGTYVAQLVVFDGALRSAPDTVVITTGANVPPVARAGRDLAAAVGVVRPLDGTASDDANGDEVTYRWALTRRPPGSAAALAGAATATPSITPDLAGDYLVQAIVGDGAAASRADTQVVATGNGRPTADAGSDRAVPVGDALTLDAADSSDPDNDALTYAWTLIATPAGSTAALTGADTATPSFTADLAGEYLVQLVVSDGTLVSYADTVLISSPGSDAGRPIAVIAAVPEAVALDTVIALDGSGSSDPDGDPLTYAWTLTAKPAGSAAAIANPSAAITAVTIDLPGLYIVELVVNDGTRDSHPATVSINGNAPPIAVAGPDRLVAPGATVALDGTDSYDQDEITGAPLTYEWIFNSKPAGSTAVFAPCANPPACTRSTSATPSFVADVPGAYALQLRVHDGLVWSDTDLLRVKTANNPPTANAGPDQLNVAPGSTITLTGAGSTDPDAGDLLTYQWTLSERPTGSSAALVNPTSVSPTFVVDVQGRYVAMLVVNDGLVSSAADSVVIKTPNRAPTANAGPDRGATVGVGLTVTGSGTDPDGDPLTYSWTLPSKPGGSSATLSGASTASPTLTPDVAGSYTLRLRVNDGTVNSPADDMIVTATSGAVGLALALPGPVGLGRTHVLNVTLPSPAPAGGLTVAVTSDDPSKVAVVAPGTAVIAGGTTAGSVQVTGVASGTTIVRGSAPGYDPGSVSVSVTSQVLTTPVSASAAVGITTPIPVTVGPSAAPAGGLVVAISSSDPAVIDVLTPTVTIPAGEFTVNANVRGLTGGTATITAATTGYASSATAMTSTGAVNILEGSATMTPGFPANIHIQLESSGSPIAAPPGGLLVTLTPVDATCVAATTATIPAGLSQVTKALAYGGTASLPCSTTLVASAGTLAGDSIPVTVNPNPGITVSGASGYGFPRWVGAGLQEPYAYFAFLGVANHGGATVRVTSSNPAVLKVAPDATTAGSGFIDVVVPDGQQYAYFHVQGMEGANGTATITATESRFASGTSGTVTVVPPAVIVHGLTTPTTPLSPTAVFFLTIGPPSEDGAYLRYQYPGYYGQPIRAGGAAVSVAVTNSSGTVGLLQTLSGSGTSRNVTFTAGTVQSPGTVLAGGIAFDPVGPGTTTVSASVPGWAPVTASSGTVTVTVPGITVSGASGYGFPRWVGAGLQEPSAYSAYLGASQHGGVTVRITSSDPAVLKVAPDATTAGTAYIDVAVADGQQYAYFYVQGMEGAAGTATVTATQAQFTSGTSGDINVVTPAVIVHSLTTPTTSLSPTAVFYVAIGPPSADGTYLRYQYPGYYVQPVRAGGTPVPVTVTGSDAAVGVLQTSAGTAIARTLTLAVGTGQSGGAVASNGIAFDPVGPGTTTVSASVPGWAPVTASSGTVTVTAPALTVYGASGYGFPRWVGAGLQEPSAYFAYLGASQHGGVTVRITSSDPAVLKVAPDATTAGTAYIDVAVADGQQYAYFYVQGMEGTAGTATITAAAPAFTGAVSGLVNVVTPAVIVHSLTTPTTSLSPTAVFYVAIGPPSADGTYLRYQYPGYYVQPVRAGGTPVAVTATTSAPAVGLLETSAGAAASRILTLGVGVAQSGGSIAANGIAFDPLAPGVTSVTATVPGWIPVTASSGSVTVTAPAITVYGAGGHGFPRKVGAGLMEPYSYFAFLGAPLHGGVTVRIASGDPTKLKVSPDATTAGTDFIDVAVADGQQYAYFFVQGVEGAAGNTTVTASQAQFTSGTSGTIEVATPAYQVFGVPGSVGATADTFAFYVTLGVAALDSFGNPTGLLYQNPGYYGQPIRPGGATRSVTVTNSNATAAQLVTAGGGAQSHVVNIVAGQHSTAGTTGAGGIAFDPLAVGATIVDATIVGLVKTPPATVPVTVGP